MTGYVYRCTRCGVEVRLRGFVEVPVSYCCLAPCERRKA